MKTLVTNEIHRFLQFHALEMQDNKIKIANRYLANYEEYIRVLSFLNSYIKTVEKALDLLDISIGEHIPPFVIIGSKVELKDANAERKYVFLTDESGEYAPVSAPCEAVPFHSGLGKELLFKEVGYTIKTEKGGNEFMGTIEQISYDLIL